MRTTIALSSIFASVLITSKSSAQTLVWNEVQTTDRGCATSISVGPNDVPWLIGCGSGADHGIYYLAHGEASCSPQPCFGSTILSWQRTPTGAAKQVAVDLNGLPFVVNSAGNVYAASTTNENNSSIIIQDAEFTGWTQLTSSPPKCMNSIAPGEDNGFALVDYTVPMSGDTDFIYGIGCSTVDSYGDRPIYSWNLDLTNILGITWNAAPWEQLDPSQGAAAVQAVLFNGPSGPSNPQTLWVRNGIGGLYVYQGGQFPQPGGANAFQQVGWTVGSLTDHYASVSFSVAGNVIYEIFQWDDASQTWIEYMSGSTSENTHIVTIASSQSIQTTGYGTFGPSSLWGIDNVGHIFFAAVPGAPPR